jgi:pimeloyl-ACP methyl ester carboxylesterase
MWVPTRRVASNRSSATWITDSSSWTFPTQADQTGSVQSVDTNIFELADGRELAFSEAGDRDGLPVLAFHGTPGSRRQVLFPGVDEVAKKVGARLIAPDRPGYGHSTFQAGRLLTDWPVDVGQIADHVGVERFAVLGISGGGPHALVCAALLADRVTRASVASGIGPVHSSADSEGMMPLNVLITSVVRHSERAIVPLTALMTEVSRRRPETALKSLKKQLPAADVAVFERPEIREAFVRDARRASSTTARATAQDMALFARPWGFELSEIVVPVDFWQGDADRNVPVAHARRQAGEVKQSTLHEFPGEGHFMALDHLEEILQAAIG